MNKEQPTQLSNHLKQYFGFDLFKKGQQGVIENLLKNESAMAIFPTGAGKSICYQLPALLLPGLTLVVSPLLSLMKDQLDFLLSLNIPAARLDSTLSREEYHSILERSKSGKLKILMISVERFKNERFRYHLEQMNISLMAIDEAHCISEWGHNFRPEYMKLPDYRKEFNIPNVLLLTATATTAVVKDMSEKFQIPDKNITITGFYRKNLYLQVSSIVESEKQSALINRISQNPMAPTIVYVTLQKTADTIARFLQSHNIVAGSYHAGLKNNDREQIQNSFIRGELNCIVATIAFGMGIDKKDIRHIIHYDLPKTIENYSQEIGRSGRDGKDSFCEVFANRSTINSLENFVYGDTPERQSVKALLEIIKQNEVNLLELKPLALSKELDIRPLPLQTLLVYLDIHGIIKPKYTYFAEYSFKYRQQPEQIVETFQGERKEFVSALLTSCETKKTWTYLNTEKLPPKYELDRKRVITALDYFDEKGWIELQAKQSVDVYEIVNIGFDTDEAADQMHKLFTEKERREINRIHKMIDFFESPSCLSNRLARYFGETIEKEMCGHCSFCTNGKATLCAAALISPITNYDIAAITSTVIEKTGGLSTRNMVKLLCGIQAPSFFKLKVKAMPEFGLLEKYSFKEVENYLVTINRDTTNS